jgi:putative peptide zinc metalloprotease protein
MKSLFSPSWYRVAGLKPRLRSHVQLHRQSFREQVWYVIQDHATGRFHRFSPAAHFMIGLMNGKRTIAEIWQLAGDRLGDDLPSQGEVIQLLAKLHHADVMHCDVPPDVAEVARRSDTVRRKTTLQSVKNPMAVRIPLIDPDRFLTATMPLVRPLLGWPGLCLWLGVVGYGVMLAGIHWSALTEDVVDRVMSVENLALLVVAYPLVKAIHELGHGYAAKRWGAEVHDIGVMFLVLFPVPYVDASAASAFPNKWPRALVGAAGILVEVFLAALGMIVWVDLEPGIVRAFAFNVMLIAGVSTLLFNGNPLLRFDGYYVLADLVEIPNLGARSNRYLLYLIQRYLFGVQDVETPVTAPGERGWFLAYGLASLGYRLFIMSVIVLFIAGRFFVVGVILAIWASIMMVVVPIAKGAWFVLTNPQLHGRRGRASATSGMAIAAVLALVFVVPVPYATVAEGVVWVPERSILRAGAEGFVVRVTAEPNSQVRAGDPIVALEDPLLGSRVRVLKAQVQELELRHGAAYVRDRVGAELIRERLNQAVAELDLARQKARDLVLLSPTDGELLLPMAADLPERFVHKGETIGYVVGARDPIVRVIVPQSDVDLVRQRVRAVDVRFANNIDSVISASIKREVPAATDRLPSLALSTVGGGAIYLDPADPGAPDKALESLFQFDLQLPAGTPLRGLGERVYVRFDHGDEALARRLYRQIRQLFLNRFDV